MFLSEELKFSKKFQLFLTRGSVLAVVSWTVGVP